LGYGVAGAWPASSSRWPTGAAADLNHGDTPMLITDAIARLMLIGLIAASVMIYWNDAMAWGQHALADAVLIAPEED
jgi:hypothetical protein